MSTVSIRELRNQGGEVVRRVEAGERITVTRDGQPVAELVPVNRRPLPLATLLERRRNMPKLDPMELRRDIDALIDPSL
jgi:prevent-host-death family protein